MGVPHQFALVLVLILFTYTASQVTKHVVVHYKYPVKVALDEAEHTLLITPPHTTGIGKSSTLYDYNTRIIAYKDLENSQCFLERMKPTDGDISYRLRQLKSQSPFSSLRDSMKTMYISDNNLSKYEVWKLAGSRISSFCRGSPATLLQEGRPQYYDSALNNELPEETVSEQHFAKYRPRRQTTTYSTRGYSNRYRGQTQSQYLAFQNGQNPGRAEAESSSQISRTHVSGTHGMGQAQSQSLQGGCEDCFPGGISQYGIPGALYQPQEVPSAITGVGVPGIGRPGVGIPGVGVGVPGAQVPGVGIPGAQVPGVGVPGVQVPGVGVPGAQVPGVGVPGAQVPGVGVPGPQVPGVGVPGAQVPGVGVPGAQVPGVGVPGAQVPGVGVPGVQVPGVGIPGAQVPGVGVPGAQVPGVGVPGAQVPGVGVPGAQVSGVGVPGAQVPGVGVPGAQVPGVGVPGAQVPGVGVPGAQVSGVGVPWAQVPGVGVPGAQVPGVGVPWAQVPGVGVPGAQVSGVGVPGAQVAGVGVPWAQVPGVGVPGAQVPGVGVPWAQVPGVGVPGTQVPGVGVPGAQVPGVGVPGAQVPGVGVPGAQVPGVGIPWTQVNGVGVPGAQVPGVSVPVAQVPGVGVPGVQMPGVGVPWTQVPGIGIPWTQIPGVGVPGAQVPGAGVGIPGFSIIGAPGARVPGAGVPGTGVGIPGIGVGIPGTGVGVPGAGVGVPGIGIVVPGAGVPGVGVQGTGVGTPSAGVGVGMPGVSVGVPGAGVGVGVPGIGVGVPGVGVPGVGVGVPGAGAGVPGLLQQPGYGYIGLGDSQAESSLKKEDNETRAVASAQGKYGEGSAQTQVSGIYSGSGSFSAQAQTSDKDRGAQSQVVGGNEGATSTAQGQAGGGKSQTQVQLGIASGATTAEAQTGSTYYGTNTQVQAGSQGGMADAQAKGQGSTSSQAQIGFLPYQENGRRNGQRVPFHGGGTASAQSGAYSGQSQSQIQGSFLHGVSYTGAAQADSGTKSNGKTNTLGRGYENFGGKLGLVQSGSQNTDSTSRVSQYNLANQQVNSPQNSINGGVSSQSSRQQRQYGVTFTEQASHVTGHTDYDDEDGGEEDEDNEHKRRLLYGSTDNLGGTTNGNNKNIFQQGLQRTNSHLSGSQIGSISHNNTDNLGSPTQTQHIILGPLNGHGAHIIQESDDGQQYSPGDVLQPGQTIHGSPDYTIPKGYRGRISSISGPGRTSAQGGQAQTVVLTPGSGNVTYTGPSTGSYQPPTMNIPVGHTRSYNPNSSSGHSTQYSGNTYLRSSDHRQASVRRNGQGLGQTYRNGDYIRNGGQSFNTYNHPSPDSFVTVTKSVTGQLDNGRSNNGTASGGKYTHTYYTKSSTCGYFTFSCNIVFGSNGRTRICKPNPPTNPDGTPCCC